MKFSISPLLFSLFFLVILFATACHTTSQQTTETALYKEGAKPELISRTFNFTEGPAADEKGNIYFTDQPNNSIWIYDTNGQLRLFTDSAGRANGLYFDADGNLLACADEKNQLWRFDKEGKVTILFNDYNGKKLNGPNDVWVHPSGAIYFTDPYYQRPYWSRKAPELEERNVYRLSKGSSDVVPVVKGLQQPNGIIGTPDGKWIYVADIGAGKTFKYEVQQDGNLDNGELFVAQGSDGMTLDEKGNVYLTGNGVTVYNPQGQQIAHIPVPEKWTANVTFGGKNRNLLFITASEAIYILEMNVRGAK